MRNPARLLLPTLLLCACAATPPRTPDKPDRPAVTVAEAYVSAPLAGEELDSLASWATPDRTVWLIATAKSSHRLLVFDADSGARLREVGRKGTAAGEFQRPNGIAVHGTHVFVVERDNHRVQVLRLPDFVPVGSFGSELLRSPYGIWLHATGRGRLAVYVTDSFMLGEKFDVVPPLAELDQRVHRFDVRIDRAGGGSERIDARHRGAFGDTSEAAALRRVESIGGDPEYDRLLIADEHVPHGSTLREYSLAGRYTGRSLPPDSFDAEAEGVALWACPDGGGYWVTVDQLSPLTRFHVFDRLGLTPRGSFSGRRAARTDGVALHAAPTARFPAGALFAVHDDHSIAAFDLRAIATALRLPAACLH